MEDDILQQISDSDVNSLMKLLESKLPLSAPVFNWLRIHLMWKTKLPDMKLEILCPRGDWRDGTVVALCKELFLDEKIAVSVFATSDRIDELMEALRDTSLIPWAHVALIPEIVVPIYQPLKDLLATKIPRRPFEDYCHLLYIPKEKAAKVEIKNSPEADVRVAPLETKHLETIMSLWSHSFNCYVPMVHAILSHNLGFGVFVGDKLVSWAVEAERGGVGMVATVPEYTKRGFASLAVSHLVRAMGQAGTNVHSTVDVKNIPSLRMHEKAGFHDKPSVENVFFSYMHPPPDI